MYQSKEIDVQYINTKEQIADMLTKNLVGEQFIKLIYKTSLQHWCL